MNGSRLWIFLCGLCVLRGESSYANPPVASYVYPAGGQRGTTVKVRVGGLFLHDKCGFGLSGTGVTPSPVLTRADRLWFEGPLLPLPESQQQEDYPADMAGSVTIAKDAAVGPRRGRLMTSQGAAGGLVFVVGELPEVVEQEADGDPIPERVALPVTANGRIFPRDDIDLWEFEAAAGQTITALVHAASLNSPLVPRLDILDAAGRVLAENPPHAPAGADAAVRFTAPAAGTYRVRITDARSQGGPQYVYRLTITAGPVPTAEAGPRAGRLAKPGQVDTHPVELKKGEKYTFDLDARRLGSPLCGVLAVVDAAGKELARAEGADAATDPTLAFTPPADGTYTVKVSERFRDRGGDGFVYGLRVTDAASTQPGFRLTLPADTLSVLRGGTVKVRVTAERLGGLTGPIEVLVGGLPDGVTAKPAVIRSNQAFADLTLEAKPDAVLGTAPVTVSGRAYRHWSFVRGEAVAAGTRFLPAEPGLVLGVGLPAPFKIIDQYVMTSAPRGELYRRKFRIERNGFDGPIEVRLADKQARHLQGVTGPAVVVPPGQTEIDYPAYLPPWMELGRTCRVCVMAVGRVKDADGREHTVSFSSTEQNQQMIVVVGPGRLDLELGKLSVRAEPGGTVRVPVTVARGTDLAGPAAVEVVIPPHWSGVTAKPVTIPAGERAGVVKLNFAKGAGGPFNMPLVVRATVQTERTPVTAEAKLEVVR